MLCVNPENGYLATKPLTSDGVCQFTVVYTAGDLPPTVDQIQASDIGLIIAAAASAYGLTFVIKLILQQLGYRH